MQIGPNTRCVGRDVVQRDVSERSRHLFNSTDNHDEE